MALDSQADTFASIVLAIQTQLVAVTELDSAFVRIVASDRYTSTQTTLDDHWLFVRPYGPKVDTDAGVGRRARRAWRRVRVWVLTRNSSDQAGEDTEALTAATAHFNLEDTVVDALDEFIPLDEDDNPLTLEPLHFLDSSDGAPERQVEGDVGVLVSFVDFECVYVLPNNTPQP